MRTSKSFANQFGITQKNVSKNPSVGIGLNPNLNIQDEYIENLLKQVHFLNMEIKLIKEKQKENKGMGIMGLLNKDTNPVVTHAITSNAKFLEMKNELENLTHNSQTDKLRLEDENFAVKAQKDYLEKLNLKEQQKNIQNKLYVQKQLGEGVAKLKANQSRLQELRIDANNNNDIYDRLKTELDNLDIKDKTKSLLKTIVENLDGEITGLAQKNLEGHDLNNQKNKSRLEQADRLFRSDPKFQELTEEQVQLKDKLKKTDKQLFDVNYRVKQMEELKKLCIRNKDVEVELKKQAGEEMQRLKKKLIDKKSDMDTKLLESKTGLDLNEEVRVSKGRLARKEKQTNDLKRKTQLSENNYKKLREEVMKLQVELEIRQKGNKEKEQQLQQMTVASNETDANLRKAELDFEKAEAELKNAEMSQKDALKRFEALEEEAAYLGAKEEYLAKTVDMDQGIRQVKIDQLASLVQANQGVNTTIGDLMEKWEQIIKFSREPPGSV